MSTPVSDILSGPYVPPGVYVSTQTTASTGAVGVGDTVLCLVGRGVGHRTATTAVTFPTGVGTVTLSHSDGSPILGIDPKPVPFTVNESGVVTYTGDGSILISQPYSGQPPYTAGTDYQIQQNTGDVDDPTQVSTTINRLASTNPIPDNATVLVRYNYTDADYHTLHSFTDYATFASLYGPALNPDNGTINSPLSLAAQFAFQNGANIIYAVAIDEGLGTDTGNGPTPEQFEAAYKLTVPNYDINIMVPLWEDASTFGGAIAQIGKLAPFLQAAEQSGFPRVALCGAAAGYPLGSDPTEITLQTAYRRIVWFWPQTFNMYNPVFSANNTMPVDAFYAAAAAAGFLANNDPDQGLTGTQLAGFLGLSADVQTAMVNITDRNNWSANGVCVYEQNRLNQLMCRHGVTTDMSNAGTRELSIVRCQDALFVEIELTLMEADLIGTPITSDTVSAVQTLVVGALETAQSNNTIADYNSVVVRQQKLPGGDPTVIEVTFNYFPTYPLNYITVVFTLDLSTGNISAPITNTGGGGGGETGLQAAG